jgi:transposase
MSNGTPAPSKRYHVTLTSEERHQLENLLNAGRSRARDLAHARILLKADEGPEGPGWADEAIRQALDVGLSTVARVRERFVEAGLEAALHPRPSHRVYQTLVDGEQEAHLIALACGQPPEGQGHWTLRLLADKMVELTYVEHISHETVRKVLKKTNSSPG